MRILVTFGSKRGGTAGLARMVGDGLREEGFAADVIPAAQVGRLDGYDAVIVGGALYAMRWHKASRRFVRSHAAELRTRPTYFFSSGPLGDSAARNDIPPVRGVKALMARCGARGHITFGGRLAADAKGYPASATAKKLAGDWRDPAQVRQWTQVLASQLRGQVLQGA
jgi:menaquinone-dependent protoporphyrinogen oxidase